MFIDAKQLPWPVQQRLASKGYSIPVAKTLDQIVVSFLTLHDETLSPSISAKDPTFQPR